MNRRHDTVTPFPHGHRLSAAMWVSAVLAVVVLAGCSTAPADTRPTGPSISATPTTTDPITEPGHGTHLHGCLGMFCVDEVPERLDPAAVPALLADLARGARSESEEQPESASSFPSSCHDVAHHVGHVVGRDLEDLVVAPEPTNTMCGFGYLHGLFEGWSEGRAPSEVGPAVLGFCDAFADRPNADRACAHGAGHALAVATGITLEPAARACTRYAPRFPEACVEGVLMSHTTSATGQGPLVGGDIDLRFPEATCSRLPGMQAPCWRYYPEIAYAAGQSTGDIARRCLSLDPEPARACGDGYGGVLLRSLEYDPDAALQACTGALQTACRIGVARFVGIIWVAAGRPTNPGPGVCTRFPVEQRAGCLSALREGMVAD